ncbi:MAG: metalloregulator ArsR/SmtB family transcription factor [Gemmatimonadaceae bacterium]
MADTSRESSPVSTLVTPRFELFYALQVLEANGGVVTAWSEAVTRQCPPALQSLLRGVAPSPLLWPLLADSLQRQSPDLAFPEMVDALRNTTDAEFQRTVLGGVFKHSMSLARMMSGDLDLKSAILAELPGQQRILELLGLHPFNSRQPNARFFSRIVSEPTAFREDVVTALEEFWTECFEKTWMALTPKLKRSARSMDDEIANGGFASFADRRRLPVSIDGDVVVNARGITLTPLDQVSGIHLIPSVLNTAGLWAAYVEADGRTRFFIPVLDRDIAAPQAASTTVETDIAPALVFKALGDTTRYAMATTLARNPMTSAEIARIFKVSKPTVSHHVQQLRNAKLLLEQQTDSGVVLSVDRAVLEKASKRAATEMFSEDGPDYVVKRSRKANKSKRSSK